MFKYSATMRNDEEIKNNIFKEFIFGKGYDEDSRIDVVTLYFSKGKFSAKDFKLIEPDENGSFKESEDKFNDCKKYDITRSICNVKNTNDMFNLINFVDHGTHYINISHNEDNTKLAITMDTEFVDINEDKNEESKTIIHLNNIIHIDKESNYYITIIFANNRINPIILVDQDYMDSTKIESIVDESNDFVYNSLETKVDIQTSVTKFTNTNGYNVMSISDLVRQNTLTSSKNFEKVKYNEIGDVIEYSRNDGLSMTLDIETRDKEYDKEYHRVVKFNDITLEDSTTLVKSSNGDSITTNDCNGKTTTINHLTTNTIEEIVTVGSSKTRTLYNNGKVIDTEQSSIEPDSMFSPYLIDGSEEDCDVKVMIEPGIMMHHYKNENGSDVVEKYVVDGDKELIFFSQITDANGNTDYIYCDPVADIRDAHKSFKYSTFNYQDVYDRSVTGLKVLFSSTCGLSYNLESDSTGVKYHDNDMEIKNELSISGDLIYECDSYLFDKDHLYIRDNYGIPVKMFGDNYTQVSDDNTEE